MTFLPTEYLNSEYLYSIDYTTENITIIKNCNNNICSCNVVMPSLDYQSTSDFICSTSDFSHFEDHTKFTDNFYYRIDLINILIILTIFILFIFIGPLKILGRLFKRFDF